MSPGRTFDRIPHEGHGPPDGGASEVIGSILMVALTVVVAMSLVSVISFADLGPSEQVRAEFTLEASAGADAAWGTGDEYVTIKHKGGEEVPRASLAIVVDNRGIAVRYSDATGNLQHSDQTAFWVDPSEPTSKALVIGERWQTPLPPNEDSLTIERGDVISVELVAGPGDPRIIWSGSVKAPPPVAPPPDAEPSPEASTITANPTDPNVGGSSTITVTVRDSQGTPFTEGGETVCLSTDHGTLTSTTGQGTCGAAQVQADDNQDGTYTATLTANTAGTATITGTLNSDAITDDATVQFLAPSADQTTITANPTQAEPDGSDESTITVNVNDQNGDPWNDGGDTVCISTDHGTLTSTTGQGACNVDDVEADDNQDGTYTATITATTPGTATITGTLNSDAITDDATVSFDDPPQPSADQTAITANPGTATADGSDESTITVNVNDQNGDPWNDGGDTVCLSTDHGTLTSTTGQGACNVDDVEADDNQDGTYTATITATTPGTATITGTLNSDAIADDATVTFIEDDAGDPSTTTIEASPTSLPVDDSSTITVTVRDSEGAPLTEGGETVCLSTDHGTLTSTTGQGACNVDDVEADDNQDGTYTATITATTPGTATITGTLNSDAITDDATVSVFALTYVDAFTANRGAMDSFSNMQSDDGALATLTEGGETQSGTPTTSTFSANTILNNPVQPNQVTWTDPTNAFTDDANLANAQVTGGANEISQIRYGHQDPTTETGDITSVILRADVQISSGQTGNAAFRLQACLAGGPCSDESGQLIGPNPGTRHTIQYDVTSLRPGGGTWTWDDIGDLETIVTALKTTNPNRSFDLFWLRADIEHAGSTTTYAMDIETSFTSVPSADTHDLELRYRANGDTFTLQAWDPSTSQWVNKNPTLSSTSLTTWSTTLSPDEYASGEPTIRFVDNTPNGETQGTLEIDYLRVRST